MDNTGTSNEQENKREESPSTVETTPSISEPKKTPSENDNVVFIGSKHLMNYVNSIDMQLKNNSEVIVKARGKFISKAVDIAEVAKRQNQQQRILLKDIKIGTEEYENEGKKVKVSTIDITVTK
jgi:archaea-specific DNA-binding protein